MGLKELRIKRNLTQKELAQISGVNWRTVQNYEQGKNDINKAQGDILYKLSKALKCRIEDLLVKENIE